MSDDATAVASDTAPEELEFEADTLTRVGAIDLAARLNAYWLAQGATTVRHWVVPVRGNRPNHAVYVVRSNLVRGQPPRAVPSGTSDTPGVAPWP